MLGTARKPVTLVIVEDSDEDFDTAVEAARRSGVWAEIRRATTGGDGIDILRSLVNRPAMVLMDLNTPDCDGREALATIKNDPALRCIPIVVLSTSANPRDLDFCYEAGVNAYHTKPVKYPEHLGLVAELLSYWLGRTLLPETGAMVR